MGQGSRIEGEAHECRRRDEREDERLERKVDGVEKPERSTGIVDARQVEQARDDCRAFAQLKPGPYHRLRPLIRHQNETDHTKFETTSHRHLVTE